MGSLSTLLLGDLPALAADPITFVEARALSAERPVRVRLGPRPGLLAATPQAVRHVLIDARDRYGKGAEQSRLRPLMGDGLVTSSGEKWEATRRAVRGAFSGEGLQQGLELAFTTLFCEAARLSARIGTPIDLHELMGRLTMRMVVAALFQERLDDAAADGLYRDGCTAHRRLTDSMWRLIDHHAVLPTAQNREFRAALAGIDNLVAGFVRSPKGTLTALRPLCDRFGTAVLRDEAVTMLIAGFETTAMAASFLAYTLAERPDLVAWLRPEVDAAMAGEWGLHPHRLKDLPRTRAVVQEVLRLYPSIWWFARMALEDDVVDGVKVRRGTSVLICPWALHRRADLWDRPLQLDPLRFLHRAQPERFAYLPFGAGPRTCIGGHLAQAELTGIAAMLVASFELEPLNGPLTAMRPVGGVTLAPPSDGLTVRFQVRQLRREAA